MLDPETLKLSNNSTQAELHIIPKKHGPISEEDIRSLLCMPNFSALFPLEQAITQIVEKTNNSVNATAGKEGENTVEDELTAIIAERRDGEVEVHISADKMQASMTLTAAWGGKEVDLQKILTQLKVESVCMGLSKAKIQKLLQTLGQLQAGESCEDVIAHGKAAVNGTDAILDRKVPLARERLLQPQVREDGTVDMRNLGALIIVNPNDLLIIKHPPTEGEPGYNVTGQILNQKSGKDVKLQPGTGTALHPKDPNRLIATITGQPVETNTGMNIDDILQLENVDVGTGHISFEGCILITGDVHEGMIVKSTGDITVMGFVDSATLEADGDIIISKGVIGRQLQPNKYSTNLIAKGQINAQFVQYSHLYAQGNILVTKQLLHSETKTNSHLKVSDASGKRGDLTGGTAHAEKGLAAANIGATGGTKTEIYCAIEHGQLRKKIKQLNENIKSMLLAKSNIDDQISRFPPEEEWKNDPTMSEQMKMMQDEKKEIAIKLNKQEVQLATANKESEEYFKKYYVDAIKHVFLNVEIHIGNSTHRTTREHGTCRIINQNQEIHFHYDARPDAKTA